MTMRKEFLINPFKRVAGAKALLGGCCIMLAGALIAWPAATHFDGALDIHFGKAGMPGWIYFAEPFIAWACTVAAFFLLSLIAAGRRFRLIDLAGTLALSRAPMLLAAPLGFAAPDNVDPVNPGIGVLLSAIPLILITIWFLILAYHAFRVSVNPRPGRAGWIFTIAVILAEILSKLAFYTLYDAAL